MADNSELETVIRNKFNTQRYYDSSGYLQVHKWSELKLQRKPLETIFFQMLKGILQKFKLIHAFMYVLVTYKNEMIKWKMKVLESSHYTAIL